LETPKPPWRARKERYLVHLAGADRVTRLVSCADKLYNARSVIADFRVHGAGVFERFSGRKVGTLWYYRALAQEFDRGGPAHMAGELRRAVDELEALAQG
jgi:GTP pyrophosphokinase